MAKDLVTIAAEEVGYKESNHRGNIYTKYGVYTGAPNGEWCHSFVAWCANKAGIPTDVFPKTASVKSGIDFFSKKGWIKPFNMKTVVRGDIVYWYNPPKESHVGIVESVNLKNKLFTTIEGNYSCKVSRVERDMIYHGIVGVVNLPYLSYSIFWDSYYKTNKNIPKPVNLKLSSKQENTINVSFSANPSDSQFALRKYNIYLDGRLQITTIDKSYTLKNVSAGTHLVSVATVDLGFESVRTSGRVTVKGKTITTSTNNQSANTGGKKTNGHKSSSQSGKEELKYLNQVLKTIKKKNEATKKQKPISYEISKVNHHHEVNVNLVIQNGKKLFSPPVIEGLKVVWERKNTAGKMTFQTISSKKYVIREGNPVLMSLNGKKFFYGFVFTIKRSKDGKLDITVYDQLRYLKNKDTYVYKKMPTDSLIRMIAKDMGLNMGILSKTKCPVTRAEDNMTLFDIISNSLNETLMVTGNMFTLYDDCGKLMLKRPTSMKVTSCLIDADTAEDYSYNRSIDQDVYNQIKLEYQNEDNKKVKFYYTRSKKNIGKWGTLQYFEKIDYPKLAKVKGEVLLKLYNRVSKTLSISGAFGNPKVRAGSLVPVLLDLGDAKVSSFLLVDKVTHVFDNGVHKMDLNLSGGDFDSSQ